MMPTENVSANLMTDRKRSILSCIIARYIHSASPIGSGQISRYLKDQVSSATIRNEMVDLENSGYIKRIHSSSGAIPCDKGYRYYLTHLESSELEDIHKIDTIIRPEFADLPIDIDAWVKRAARVLSRLVHNVALITAPLTKQKHLKELHLVHLKGLLALVILVYNGANFGRYLVRLNNLDDPDNLQVAANRINHLLATKNIKQVHEESVSWSPLEREVLLQVQRLLSVDYHQALGDQHIEGLTRISAQPEFAGSIGARDLLAVLEDQDVVSTSLLESAQEGMRVIIGTENPSHELRPFTMIVSSYGNSAGLMGLLAAVGPTRMDYVRAIGGVRSVSGIMSELVEEL